MQKNSLPLVKNSLNKRLYSKENRFEVNDMPSETVPDQSMSVNEIMRRFASGLPVTGGKVPIYDGEEDFFPDLSTLDLAEVEELVEQAREQKNKIESLKLRQKKEKEEQLFQDELDRRINELIEKNKNIKPSGDTSTNTP